MRRLLIVLVVAFVGAGRAPAASATPQLQIISQNPDFITLAVDHNGVAYGEPVPVNGSYSYMLYRSTDEGQTWTHIYDFPAYSHMYFISVLTDNTLIAHVDTGSMNLYRSGDGGTTWGRVLTMPTSPVFYTTLTAHSVTDLVTNNNRYVFAGSYNTGDAGNHTNYIWRSADNGFTWSLVYQSVNHRHIHFIQANPYSTDIYVGYGDAGSQVSIERSSDQGVTWVPICTGDPCTAVDIAFDPSGFAVFGQDHPFSDTYVMRMDLATGALTQTTKLPGPSYSDLHVSQDVWLVGETHEPGMVDDGYVHLFASDDGARTFVDVFKKPYVSANSYAKVLVQFAYPNGDVPIRIDGYGTFVGRIVSSSTAPDFALSAAPATQSVTAGASTQYTTSVSSLNGFAGDVALTVTGLPQGASATFSPASVSAPGTSTLAITSSVTTPAGTYTLSITGTAGTTTHSTSVSYVVAAAPVPDFAISASPSSQSVAAGGSVSYGVSVATSNGFTGDIGLSLTGLPAGATATFTPTTVAAPGSSTLDITSTTSTPTGSYTLVVSGTAADGRTRSTTVTYTTTTAVIPDFTLDVSPKSRVTAKKTSVSYTTTVAASGGFSGVVTLAVAGLPAGATASFSPPTITTAGTSKVTVTTSNSSPIGQYRLQITASSGSLSHTATATLTIK